MRKTAHVQKMYYISGNGASSVYLNTTKINYFSDQCLNKRLNSSDLNAIFNLKVTKNFVKNKYFHTFGAGPTLKDETVIRFSGEIQWNRG